MKKITYILVLIVIHAFVLVASTNAVEAPTPTATESATPTPTSKLDITVESLKKRIETKVQEMSKKSKKMIAGIVEDVTDSTATIKTDTDVEYKVSLDETITTIKKTGIGEEGDLELADLEKGMFTLVTGPMIENQVTANVLYVQKQHLVIQGLITNITKSSFTLDVTTIDKDTFTLDIEDDTQQTLMDSKTLELAKTGFSKMRIGDTIHAVIDKPSSDSKSTKAHRILILPQEYFEGL